VEVLGPHFNVHAYENENMIYTTLLEGSIRVQTGQHERQGITNNQQAILKPGQQARIGSAIQVVNNVNLEQAVAWKNGFFLFQGASLREVMQQLSRWYDVDIGYEGKTPERRFVGKVGRDYTLSEVLSVLGASDVHYTIEGRRLIIQP